MPGNSQSIIMLIGFGICATGFLYVCVPYLHGRYLRIWLGHKASKSSALVLTFDDGPGIRLTPAILDILQEHNVKASFFLLGRNIAGREEIVKRIVEQGHEICSHGYDHLQYWKVSPLRALSDIKRGWETIDTVLEVKRRKYPFRPPYGKLNVICWLYLLIRKVPIIYWSFDLGDTWAAQSNNHRIELFVQKAGGAISLAHDFDRPDDSMDGMVMEFVRSALSMAKKKNLRVLTVSQFLSDRP